MEWANLIVGVVGVLVAAGAWFWSAIAAKRAGKAETAANNVSDQYAELRAAIAQPPVFADDPSFSLQASGFGYLRLRNSGPGTAYKVQARPLDTRAAFLEQHAWNKIEMGQEEIIRWNTVGDVSLGYDNRVEISWLLPGNERDSVTLNIPDDAVGA